MSSKRKKSPPKLFYIKKDGKSNIYRNFELVKNNIVDEENDIIVEYVPNGVEYSLEEYKNQLKRDQNLESVLDNGYPQLHHLRIIELINERNIQINKLLLLKKSSRKEDNVNRQFKHLSERVLDEIDLKKFIVKYKDFFFKVCSNDINDFESLLRCHNFLTVPSEYENIFLEAKENIKKR